MRTSFIVGIFALSLAAAGAVEWASRRALNTPAVATTSTQIDRKSDREPTPTTPVAPDPVSRRDAPDPAGADPASEPAAHTLVLAEAHGGFRLNAVTLSEDAVDAIDEFLAGLDCDMSSAHFVIEGHTDNLGSPDVNQKIGLARALAVRQYLADQHEIPLDLMRVVSVGSDQPVADNATQEGRSTNRRVVIKVFE